MKNFVITLSEYNRIHQLIHGVIRGEGCVERGCTFFSIVGSYLLNKHFRIPATAVAGGFALCVEEEKKCIIFGKEENKHFRWGEDGFHMWVQTESHIIDFMAPLYREAFAVAKPDVDIPRKMFQKLRADDKRTLDDVSAVGDYIVFPDPALTERLIDNFLRRVTNTDLLQVAEAWFGTRRRKQRPTLAMGSNDGIIRHLTLPSTVANGAW
jgi:hypothetical protein